MRIASVATAYPPYRYPQAVLTAAVKRVFKDKMDETRIIDRLHSHCGVDYRHVMFPIDNLGMYSGFEQSNDAWVEGALEIGQQAIETALDRAGLEPTDISAIFVASTTGLAMPSLDARLINRMGFKNNTKRTPIFGLGCAAGAVGISRAADYVRAYPKQYAIFLSVELCSLNWQDADQSVGNIVACGLFGDGAGAVVVAGEDTYHAQRPSSLSKPCPRVMDTRSTMYPNTEHVVGLKFKNTGFNVVLSPEIPGLIHKHMRGDVDSFLADNNLNLKEIYSFIFHNGGPKVLQAMEKALDLPAGALDSSWERLREVGNVSSVSVLSVMEEEFTNRPGDPGSHSMMASMGPAFCSELILLQW